MNEQSPDFAAAEARHLNEPYRDNWIRVSPAKPSPDRIAASLMDLAQKWGDARIKAAIAMERIKPGESKAVLDAVDRATLAQWEFCATVRAAVGGDDESIIAEQDENVRRTLGATERRMGK